MAPSNGKVVIILNAMTPWVDSSDLGGTGSQIDG